MSFLDVYERDARQTMAPQTGEQARLPATFGDAFEASWSNAYLWGQSIAGNNAREAAVGDYVGELNRRTGEQFDALDPSGFLDVDKVKQHVDELRAKRPDLNLEPLTDDEIEQRAVKKSQAARSDYADMAQREKTLAGSFGSFLGSAAGAATDPVNLLALPVAPAEGLGLLATAARWAMIGGAAQLGIEVMRAPFAEEVQPGYGQTLEPLVNVGEGAAGAAALGFGTKFLGNLWTRMKTGAWPQSIRDAGNIAESEANVLNTNVLRGAEGETAHREALSKAIDDLVNGKSVDVNDIMPPGAWEASRRLIMRLEGEQAVSLPVFNERAISLISEEAGLRERDSLLQSQLESVGEGNAASAEKLARLQVIETQMAEAVGDARRALSRRRDELLTDTTPDQLRAEAAPIELRRQAGAERQAIATRLAEIDAERAKTAAEAIFTGGPVNIGQRSPVRFEPIMDVRAGALKATEAAKAEMVKAGSNAELPFTATAHQAQAEKITGALADGIGQIARRAGYGMPSDEAVGLAKRLLQATDDEAGVILDELALRPRTIADTLPSASAAAKERRAAAKAAGEPMPAELQDELSPKRLEELRKDPELDETILRDLDRLRAEKGDVEIPVGEEIGPSGERVVKTRKIESVLDEADRRLQAAKEIEACAGPQPEFGAAE